MHSNNISQNIIDSLRLCDEYDIEFLQVYVEKLVGKNSSKWNDSHMV